MVEWREDARRRLKEKSQCSRDWLHDARQSHDDSGHMSADTHITVGGVPASGGLTWLLLMLQH